MRQGTMPQGRSRSSSSKWSDIYPTPAWQVADEFSSELRPKVFRAATLVSGPTAAWGTAGLIDEKTATLYPGQAIDDDDKT